MAEETPRWVEVWGKEPGGTRCLLYKFPINQWVDGFDDRLTAQMAEQGVTEIEVKKVP